MAGGLSRRPDQYERPEGVGAPARGAGFPSSNLVNARRVVIFGANGGLFVYSGTPAGPPAGNLIASIAATAGVDPYGNSYRQGITSYVGGSIVSARLNGAQVLFDGQAGTLLSAPGAVYLSADALAVSTAPSITVAAPQTSAINNAALILFGESQDASQPAQAVIGLSGATPLTAALLEVQGSIETTALANIIASGNLVALLGSLIIETAGQGLEIKEGANARMGTAQLAGGTLVVANTSVTANTRVFCFAQTTGANSGAIGCTSRIPGTSFTITSTNGADANHFAWLLIEPA